MTTESELSPKEINKQSVLLLALAASVLYGTVMTWRYVSARRELAVYQKGALALIANKVQAGDFDGQEERMAEIGLLDAPNDSSRYLTSPGPGLVSLPPGQD